eukprot:jgi/Psemu1/10272/gm1.10272_g
MSSSVEFTITYVRFQKDPIDSKQQQQESKFSPLFASLDCDLVDGGQQEYQTALGAVRKVFPDAPVVEHRVDKYPIKVIVTAAQSQSGTETKIWSGKQQNLFSKYAAKRTKAIQEIVDALEEFKKGL